MALVLLRRVPLLWCDQLFLNRMQGLKVWKPPLFNDVCSVAIGRQGRRSLYL